MNAFLFCVNILLLVFLWNKVWQPHQLATCRDRLFNQRSAIRQYFLEHNLKLDSEAYKFARDLVNIQIRYADHISLFNIMASALFFRKCKPSEPLITGLRELPKEHFEAVEAMIEDGTRAIVVYVVLRSFIVTIFYVPIDIISRLFKNIPPSEEIPNKLMQKNVERELNLEFERYFAGNETVTV